MYVFIAFLLASHLHSYIWQTNPHTIAACHTQRCICIDDKTSVAEAKIFKGECAPRDSIKYEILRLSASSSHMPTLLLIIYCFLASLILLIYEEVCPTSTTNSQHTHQRPRPHLLYDLWAFAKTHWPHSSWVYCKFALHLWYPLYYLYLFLSYTFVFFDMFTYGSCILWWRTWWC